MLATAVVGTSVASNIAQGETGSNNLPGSATELNKLNATPSELVKNYTNYYEFTFDKEGSTKLAQNLQIDPWRVEIAGEVEKNPSPSSLKTS